MFEVEVDQNMSTQLIVRSAKVRRGDTIVEAVADGLHPYREVYLTEHPVTGEIFYQGHWHQVRYFTGLDQIAKKVVKYTATEFSTWQVVRPVGQRITVPR